MDGSETICVKIFADWLTARFDVRKKRRKGHGTPIKDA